MSHILTINAGSSSVRFALFSNEARPLRLLAGKMERIGDEAANAIADGLAQKLKEGHSIETPDAIGHRVVHGMLHSQPERVSPALLAELRRSWPHSIPSTCRARSNSSKPCSPLSRRCRKWPASTRRFIAACPRRPTLLPIPRRYAASGVQRYGFHGLSYTFLMQELQRLGDAAASRGRVILAHLGSGASLAAVLDGRCIDTSMGFTPAAGLVMGTRSGDLDPGLASYLMLSESMSAAQFQTMVNQRIRAARHFGDQRRCPRFARTRSRRPACARGDRDFLLSGKKMDRCLHRGAWAASTPWYSPAASAKTRPSIRRRICDGLAYPGVELDDSRNAEHAPCISTGRVAVRVIRTDEESVIASLTAQCLGLTGELNHARRWPNAGARCGIGAQDRCLLARRKLSVRRPNLSLRQPLVEGAAGRLRTSSTCCWGIGAQRRARTSSTHI